MWAEPQNERYSYGKSRKVGVTIESDNIADRRHRSFFVGGTYQRGGLTGNYVKTLSIQLALLSEMILLHAKGTNNPRINLSTSE